MRTIAALGALWSLAGCSGAPESLRTGAPTETPSLRAESRAERGSASTTASPNDSRAPAAPNESPRRGPRGPGTFALDVPGFDAAIVSFPSGDASREPVLIAAHGAGDNPVWQCETWREILGDRAIILCLSGPREMPRSDARYFPDHFALEKIAFASLETLRRALPEPSRARRVVYTGYSQGATMGALMIVAHGDSCPRLVLVEGGFDGWTLARAEKFKRTGGERVLFVCGTGHCRKRAEASSQTLVRAGIAARVVADLSAGHNYGGAAARAVKDSFAWLVEGDADWSPAPARPAAKDARPKAPEVPASPAR